MAENKKSFVLYADQSDLFNHLPDEVAGKLIKLIFQYVNDKNPETDDLLLKIAFEPIKRQLKRDLKEWEEELKKRSDSGILGNLKRWHPDLYAKVIGGKLSLEDAIKLIPIQSPPIAPDKNESPPIANIAVNDTVNVNVTVNDINTEIQNNTLKGEKHFEHIKEFYSHPYEKQFQGFKNTYSKTEYEQFQKFLSAMFRDFTIAELTSNYDKCLGIGDWNKYFKGCGFLKIKPALTKSLGAKEGNRENMAMRIVTYANGLFDEKVFSK